MTPENPPPPPPPNSPHIKVIRSAIESLPPVGPITISINKRAAIAALLCVCESNPTLHRDIKDTIKTTVHSIAADYRDQVDDTGYYLLTPEQLRAIIARSATVGAAVVAVSIGLTLQEIQALEELISATNDQPPEWPNAV